MVASVRMSWPDGRVTALIPIPSFRTSRGWVVYAYGDSHAPSRIEAMGPDGQLFGGATDATPT